MYKICVFIPENSTDTVKQAMFDAGAGKIGNYDCCSWEILGHGQFRPLQGSNPHTGSLNTIETVAEYRVEMVCDDRFLRNVIRAMKASHPYEEPAYDVWKLENIQPD